MTEETVIKKFIRMFGCDTARISNPSGDMMFLIIGHNRNTKDDPGFWVDEKGNERNWDYVAGQVIASGATEADLMDSAKFYKRISGMTMLEYLKVAA